MVNTQNKLYVLQKTNNRQEGTKYLDTRWSSFEYAGGKAAGFQALEWVDMHFTKYSKLVNFKDKFIYLFNKYTRLYGVYRYTITSDTWTKAPAPIHETPQ